LPLDPERQNCNEEIARLVAQDREFGEIGELVGCTAATVSNVIRNDYPHLRKDPGRDDNIRREHRAGKTQKELAQKYGLSKSQVWEICKKKQGE
jgi:predicted transcriptional regulator